MTSQSSTRSERLIWDENLLIGIQMPDRDHEQIVFLINRVLDAMAESRPQSELSHILDSLIAFAQEHFRREEELMERYGYPELQPHREVHRFLEKKIMAYKTDFLTGGAEFGLAAELMKDWIVLHIQGVDRKYSRFLLARGVV
ncbi:MAG: hemerythrin family protein [Magnetococcales bacterium]|nr:hemerythrin family protein [Magnetococcales bacterium]